MDCGVLRFHNAMVSTDIGFGQMVCHFSQCHLLRPSLTSGKKVQIRKPAPSGSEPVAERKRSTPINPANTIRKCLANNPVSQRPYRDRLVHLLALRSYKKLELLARLQRDGVSQKDRSSLGSTLQQVRLAPCNK